MLAFNFQLIINEMRSNVFAFLFIGFSCHRWLKEKQS